MGTVERWLKKSVLLWAIIWGAPLWGQSSAEIRGRVVDAGHAPVMSALVIITAQDTLLMRAATTDEAREFEFPSLPVGSYSLEVKADGFLPFACKDIRASIGQVVRLELALGRKDAGGSGQAVREASAVEAGNAELGVVMGEGEVTKLPLKSRDTFELLQLQPGVQSTLGADLFFGSDLPGVVSVSGGRARSNNYNINGGTAGDQMVNFPSLQPSPDSISEFRVISHNYEAALGRNSGSVLNVVTKSGGPGFHGSAYEFLRKQRGERQRLF